MAATRKNSWFTDLYGTFRESIYSPPFYAAVAKQKTSIALGYFMKLAVVLTLMLIVASGSFLVGIVQFERNLPDLVTQLSNNFPAELAVTIKNGHATTNVTEPYFIPKDNLKDSDPNFQHYIVVDTKTPYTSEQFANYHSYAWLTSDTLFYYSQYNSSSESASKPAPSQIRAMPLSEVSDMVIDRSKVHGWIAMLEPWVRWLTPVFALFVLGLLYVAVLTKLIYLFALALLVWVIGKLLKKGFDYGASYRIALYAASLGFLLSELAGAVRLHVPWFSVTVLSLLIVVLNLLGGSKRSELGFIRFGVRSGAVRGENPVAKLKPA